MGRLLRVARENLGSLFGLDQQILSGVNETDNRYLGENELLISLNIPV